MRIGFGRYSVVVQLALVFLIGQEEVEVGFDATKVAEFHTLPRERPDGFAPITGIIDAKQIAFLGRERMFYESSNLQCLISREKMSKDDQRVILLESVRFCFVKSVALQGFFGPKQGFKSNIHC